MRERLLRALGDDHILFRRILDRIETAVEDLDIVQAVMEFQEGEWVETGEREVELDPDHILPVIVAVLEELNK